MQMPARDGKKKSRSRSHDVEGDAGRSDDENRPPKRASSVDYVEEDDGKSLITTLKKKRKRTQKELDEAVRDQEHGQDVGAELQKAKVRTKEKLKALAETAADEAAEDTVEESTLEKSTDRTSVRPKTPRLTSLLVSGDMPSTPKGLVSNQEQYREKLAQLKKAAKDRGKQEAFQQSKTRRLVDRDTSRLSRFDTADLQALKDLEEEEEKLQQSLQQKEKLRESLKHVRGPVFHMPSEQEALDFFTQQWGGEMEVATKDKDGKKTDAKQEGKAEGTEVTVEKKEGQGIDGEKEEDKENELMKEADTPLIPDEDEDAYERHAWLFYRVGRAQYVPYQERFEIEEKDLTYVSIAQAPVEDRLFDRVARNLEEEGLFVGQRPYVSDKVLFKMENRLLLDKDQAKDWFNENGRLLALPDPTKTIPTRPIVPEEIQEPALKCDYIKAEVSQFDSRYIDGSVEPRGLYRLDVDINAVTFKHHHLFSKEHVLAQRLTELFQQYNIGNIKNSAIVLNDKIKALKIAISHVEENISHIKSDRRNRNVGLKEQEHRLMDYKLEIRQVIKQRDIEMKADRDLIKHILQTWKDLKTLRRADGYNNTTVKLIIKREEPDKVADDADWAEDIKNEMEVVAEEMRMEYESALEKYQTEMEEYQKQKDRKKEARKRRKELRKKHKMGESPSDEAVTHQEEKMIVEDEATIAEPDLPVPTEPNEPSTQGVREKILDKFNNIRRKPGEPIIHLELSNDVSVTAKDACPSTERQRRSDVNRYKIYIRVLFNNKEVSRTSARPLGHDFAVCFSKIFPIEIVQWPSNICMQVFETTATVGTGAMLCEVYLAIPDINVTMETVQLDEIEFSSATRVKHTHTGVGCGEPFRLDSGESSELLSLYTGGVLTCSVAWGVDPYGIPLVPPSNPSPDYLHSAMKNMDPLGMLGMAALSDITKLTKWIQDSKLDPNDPSNADLMYHLRPSAGTELATPLMNLPQHFRLDHLQENFNFCTDEDIDKSRRYRMITLRERETPEFKNKVIPALDKEISDEVFQEYEKKLREEKRITHLAESSNKALVQRYMQEIKKQVFHQFQIAAHQKTFGDMVYEDAIPNVSRIIPNLMLLAEPRRPLRPVRKERKKVTPQNLQSMEVAILVNVVRAFDVPIREEAINYHILAKEQEGQGPRELRKRRTAIKNIAGRTLVRPFIEAVFQKHTVSTTVADGPNPSWNEELVLPFSAPNNDYSPANLQAITDDLYLNLFDEYVEEKVEQSDKEGETVKRHIEKRRLGSFKIPFSTIYYNSRIDGTFKIIKPPVLLGYKHQAPMTDQVETDAVADGGSGETYITLFVTVEPPLAPAELLKQKFMSKEDDNLVLDAERFVADFQQRFIKRQLRTLVVDINGKSVFITRYFKALNIPPVLIVGNSTVTRDQVCRFVSLIPFASDSVTFPGLLDIWSTCDQFLLMCQGDEDEHAVLLTNYFLSPETDFINAWLVLGNAVPEGPTAYVLTEEVVDGVKEYTLWNANTGDKYSPKDHYCPLKSIGCLINHENIWANIQVGDHPSRVTFDLHNTKLWKPFFTRKDGPVLSSIQPDRVVYLETDKAYVIELQEKIERYLKDKLQEWRPKYITRWNRYCVHTLRRLLEKLETAKTNQIQQEHTEELNTILGSYKMSGFPINGPYVDMERLADEVYATGVHKLDTSDVEFALAVHIHPYPNMVMSVWIYVASLIRKR